MRARAVRPGPTARATPFPRATGKTYQVEWVQVFTIRGDKVVRFREYFDTAPFRAAFA